MMENSIYIQEILSRKLNRAYVPGGIVQQLYKDENTIITHWYGIIIIIVYPDVVMIFCFTYNTINSLNTFIIMNKHTKFAILLVYIYMQYQQYKWQFYCQKS